MMRKLSTLLLLLFVVLVVSLQAMAQQQSPPLAPQPPYAYGSTPWPMWGYDGAFQFWWICPLMTLFMLLVFGIIFFFARRSWAEGPHHWGPPWHMMHGAPPTHSALQILNERFARGEIQQSEYEDKKAKILSGAQH